MWKYWLGVEFKRPQPAKSENLQLFCPQSRKSREFPGTGDWSQELGRWFGSQKLPTGSCPSALILFLKLPLSSDPLAAGEAASSSVKKGREWEWEQKGKLFFVSSQCRRVRTGSTAACFLWTTRVKTKVNKPMDTEKLALSFCLEGKTLAESAECTHTRCMLTHWYLHWNRTVVDMIVCCPICCWFVFIYQSTYSHRNEAHSLLPSCLKPVIFIELLLNMWLITQFPS